MAPCTPSQDIGGPIRPETMKLARRTAGLEPFLLLALAVNGLAVAWDLKLGPSADLLVVTVGAAGVAQLVRPSNDPRGTCLRGLLCVATTLGLLLTLDRLDSLVYAWLLVVSMAYPFLAAGVYGLAVPIAAAAGYLATIPIGSPALDATTLSRVGLLLAVGTITRRLRANYLADLRDMERLIDALQGREPYVAAVLQGLPTPTAVVDARGTVKATNRAWASLLREHGLGDGREGDVRWLVETLWADSPETAGHVLEQITGVLGGDPDCELEVRFTAGSRSPWYELQVKALPRPPGGVTLSFTDISALRLNEQLAHEATHDPLTHLPNRSAFAHALQQVAAASPRTKTPYAVLFIDLDRFKHVNDTLGHAAGDELLIQVAARLRGELRPADLLARLAGDEFVVLITDASVGAAPAAIAERLRAAISETFWIGSQAVRIGASVGVATSGDDGADDEDASALLARADAAMYRAKQAGKHRLSVIDLRARPAGHWARHHGGGHAARPDASAS